MTAAASCTLCISLFAYIKMTRRNYLFLFIAIQVISILQLSAAAVSIAVSLAMLIGLFKVCNLLETTRQSWHINPAYVISCGQQLHLAWGGGGDIIIFVSSRRRRLEARNVAVIFIFIPFTTYKKTSFKEEAGRSFTNGFSGPKNFRDFRETGPRCVYCMLTVKMNYRRKIISP